MHQQSTAARVSGHVGLKQRKRGPQWYAKYRLPDGRQVQRRLGPAWTGKGRPPEGHLTRRTAEEALAAILTDARRGELAVPTGVGPTFADAAAEYLRYVEEERDVDVKTARDYRGVVDRY